MLRAYAKINLHLRVLRKRADGFHDLLTWMQRVDWFDELEIRSADTDGVAWSCDDARLGPTADNLVIRAANAFGERCGVRLHVAVRLVKRLPQGAGLGGGSSDAAAMLIGLARMHGIASNDARLFEAAADVGSDVPFFLGGGAAIATDRGTVLAANPRPFDGFATLILPGFGTSTPRVYGACRPRAMETEETPPWGRSWKDAEELSLRLENDLLHAACAVEPRLGALWGRVNGIDDVRVHLSGSGSTLFALFDEEAAARAWAARAESALTGAGDVATRVVRVLSD